MPTIVLLLSLFALAVPASAGAQDAVPREPADVVLDALRDHPIVAIGEDHGFADEHEVLRRLLRDRRVQDAIQDIVVEFGSAQHQRTIDAYVNGADVPRSKFVTVWRDSVGGGPLGTWDAPVYEQFFRQVREVNRSRPEGRKLRVLLSDPPVDWRTATARSLRTVDRDGHMAEVMRREVLAKGRKALWVAGQLHLLRVKPGGGPAPPGAPPPNPSAVVRLDETHPGAVYVIALPPLLDDTTEPILRSWPIPSFAALAGSALGRHRAAQPPGAPPAASLEELADALAAYAPVSAGRFSTLYPKTYTDRERAETVRRLKLAGPVRNIDDPFLVTCSLASIDGRGIAQPARGRGLAGEPAGGMSGSAPHAVRAADAVLRAWRTQRVVALGYHPASDQSVGLLATLAGDRRVARGLAAIVIDFGHPRHQRLVDAYTSGRNVSEAALARVWRDADQLLAYDAERFRAVLAAARKTHTRVILAGAAVDWRRRDLRRHAARAMARQPQDMAGRIAGLKGRVLVFALRRRVVQLRDAHVIVPLTGLRGAAREQLTHFKPGTIAAVRGTWLAGLSAGANLGAGRLGRLADSVAFLGTREQQTSTSAPPSAFPDRYWAEVRRRHRALVGHEVTLPTAFPTSDCEVGMPGQGGGPQPSHPSARTYSAP